MRQLLALLIIAIAAFICRPALADFEDGLNAYDKENYKIALREFKPLAEKGKADAQFYLGVMYQKGWGVPQDYKEAARLYRLAAEQGFAPAQGNLGLIYYHGLGIPQDYKEAVKWWKLNAEQWDATAQNNLGTMYANGNGVPQDYILAHMWYNLAASNGYEKATEYRDDVAKKMTPEQIGQAQTMARECAEKNYKGC